MPAEAEFVQQAEKEEEAFLLDKHQSRVQRDEIIGGDKFVYVVTFVT